MSRKTFCTERFSIRLILPEIITNFISYKWYVYFSFFVPCPWRSQPLDGSPIYFIQTMGCDRRRRPTQQVRVRRREWSHYCNLPLLQFDSILFVLLSAIQDNISSENEERIRENSLYHASRNVCRNWARWWWSKFIRVPITRNLTSDIVGEFIVSVSASFCDLLSCWPGVRHFGGSDSFLRDFFSSTSLSYLRITFSIERF